MKPIVLVGGGENHFRLIQLLSEIEQINKPIILISKNQKVFNRMRIPEVLEGALSSSDCYMDLWSACQRTGVYFLNDECININRDDKMVYLKKFGKLEYGQLSIETQCVPFVSGLRAKNSPTLIALKEAPLFLEQVRAFLEEVHKHCPKEIRVVIYGLTQQSLHLGSCLNQFLSKSCEIVDIVVIAQGNYSEKRLSKKQIKLLSKHNIRCLENENIEVLNSHNLKFSSGKSLDFDVVIPMEGWRSQDLLGKLFQSQDGRIYVNRDFSDSRDPNVFISGNNVQFTGEKLGHNDIQREEIQKVLLHNLFKSDEDAPRITCRNRRVQIFENSHFNKEFGIPFLGKKTSKDLRKENSDDLKLPHIQRVADKVLQDLRFEAEHMSRPWKGLSTQDGVGGKSDFRLNSFNGFNCWGSYADSAVKICEIAILKAMTKGVKPAQLRFNLTLPKSESFITGHIFESTFKAIEGVAIKHGIEVGGGDTFDGLHWHLMVTVGGKTIKSMNSRFEPHDYLLITRPLGFGFLWASRLHNQFDSNWINANVRSSVLVEFQKFQEFLEKFNPSNIVLIEEWGFLYHCLQSLPAHQQLTINFREVPRWRGIEEVLSSKTVHPGLETNWQRIAGDVAFSRNEISLNNSVLWDSLSQGSMVIGIKANSYKQALCQLKDMGYKDAALVGSVRPKSNGNKVVLSDWMPG